MGPPSADGPTTSKVTAANRTNTLAAFQSSQMPCGSPMEVDALRLAKRTSTLAWTATWHFMAGVLHVASRRGARAGDTGCHLLARLCQPGDESDEPHAAVERARGQWWRAYVLPSRVQGRADGVRVLWVGGPERAEQQPPHLSVHSKLLDPRCGISQICPDLPKSSDDASDALWRV